MVKCQKCGLPQFSGPAGYAGPACKCWAFYAPEPAKDAHPSCRPVAPLTEADVRRIIREELARTAAPKATALPPPYYISGPYHDGGYAMCLTGSGRVVHYEPPYMP